MKNTARKIYKGIVKKNETSVSLCAFVKKHFTESFSMRAIKRLIGQGFVKVNGKIETYASMKLHANDQIEFISVGNCQHVRLVIDSSMFIYEDSILLAVNKPSGYPSSETESERINVFSELKKYILQKQGIEIFELHRLDRDTSGVLLFIKDISYKQFFLKQFKNHLVSKHYLALVAGVPEKKSGTLKSNMGILQKRKGFEKRGIVPSNQGKLAISHYKILKSYKDYSLLSIAPETGRTHQIRIHMAEIGHPVLGDMLYGKNHLKNRSMGRHMLHAYKLIINHPLKEKIIIKTRMPDEFFFHSQIHQTTI